MIVDEGAHKLLDTLQTIPIERSRIDDKTFEALKRSNMAIVN